MDESQNYEKLSADRDFEGGEWIDEVSSINLHAFTSNLGVVITSSKLESSHILIAAQRTLCIKCNTSRPTFTTIRESMLVPEATIMTVSKLLMPTLTTA